MDRLDWMNPKIVAAFAAGIAATVGCMLAVESASTPAAAAQESSRGTATGAAPASYAARADTDKDQGYLLQSPALAAVRPAMVPHAATVAMSAARSTLG